MRPAGLKKKEKIMAIFHCEIKPISRGQGRSAVAASAYRAAEYIVDQQTGQVYDYTKKHRVLETQILTPNNFQISRQDLWNLAAKNERRKDSREAREFEIALPKELPREESIALAKKFGQSLVDRFEVAADVCIHKSGAGSDKNIHAHIMITTRKFSEGQLLEKTILEQEDKKLKAQNLPTGRQQITLIRKAWATICNEKLQEHGIAPISHLSLKDQGIERLPQIHLGQSAAAMERRGIHTEKGDKNRHINEPLLTYGEIQELKKYDMVVGQKWENFYVKNYSQQLFKIDEQREQFFAERQVELTAAREAHFEATRQEISLSYKQPVRGESVQVQPVQQPVQPVAAQVQREAPQTASEQLKQEMRPTAPAEKEYTQEEIMEEARAAYADWKQKEEEKERIRQQELEEERQERRHSHSQSL